MLGSVIGGVADGLVWSVLALGVYITYRILDFADLSVDGTLATGGCVAAVMIVNGVHPLIALLGSFAAGALAGTVTALLNTKLKIPAILSGILTMSALYSVNIRILSIGSDSAVSSLTIKDPLMTIGGKLAKLFGLSPYSDKDLVTIIICIAGLLAIIGFMYWFFGTEEGTAIRATGDNPVMATAQGINTDRSKIIALAFSNGLAALAGGIYAQYNFNANVGMASGTIVIGLASVIIGELVFGKKLSFWIKLLGVVVGSVIYRLIIVFAVMFGMNTDDLKLIASVIVVIALCIPRIKAMAASAKKKKEAKADA